MHRRWVRIVVLVAAVFLAAVIALPFLVDADRFRPTVENQLSSGLGRPVTMGHLKLSLLTGSLVAEKISIGDDAAFSHAPMLQARAFRLGVRILPLLMQRKLSVTGAAIESPVIQLIEAQDGRWNYSSLGGTSPSASSAQNSSALPDLYVDELKIVNGQATLSKAGQKPLQVTGINLTVKQFSLTGSFPFQLAAQLPGGGSLKVEGAAGPLAQNDAELTPFDARVHLEHFDIAAVDGMAAASGMAGVVDVEAHSTSRDGLINTSGKIRAAHLKLVRRGAAAEQPVEVDYSLTNNLAARSGQVQDVALHAGAVAAHLTGSYQMKDGAVQLNLHLSAPGMPIDGLENLLPSVGVTLPSGSRLRGGTLTAELAITGTADQAEIAGPVAVSNTVLAGYDLGAHIGGVNPFGGSGGGTRVETLKADLKATPQGDQLNNIVADLPQVGTATGSGTVSAQEELNFQLVAKFSPTTGVGMVLGKGVNAITGLLGKAMHSKAAEGVPVTVQGTASNPIVHAHLGEMLKPRFGSAKSGEKKK
jgi:AsmA protein